MTRDELEERDFHLLLKVYEIDRLDDIQAASTMLALLAPTLGLISLIGFALINANSLPKWLLALVPLPPLPFIAFGALYAHLAQVRGALIDRYEERLRLQSEARAGGLEIPIGHHILGRVWTSSYGRTVIGISATSLFALYVGVIVMAFRDSRRAEPVLAWFGLTFASTAVSILIALYVLALWPERVISRYSHPLTAASAVPAPAAPGLVSPSESAERSTDAPVDADGAV